jgi:hypothetical protein
MNANCRLFDSIAVPVQTAISESSVMANTTPHDERRAFQREDVALSARVVSDGESVEAQSINLSESGILLAGTDFPSATQVRIEIELAEIGWHSLEAEVVRADDGRTMAARFAEVATEGGREAIRAFFASRLAGSVEDTSAD